jgi:DtxR family transcriptional regulator, Mn-dependent transcriptional regulator
MLSKVQESIKLNLVASSTVEDYLKCIYVQERGAGLGGLVPTGQIATLLEVAPGTATAMVKTLADSGLVVYEPYAGVRLTPAGQRLATRVLRRHRLVELFLVKVMGMNWSDVHGDAEILEHAVSDRLLERMDEMLGSPSSDPHGDPIPSSEGELVEPLLYDVLSCPLNVDLRLARVTDQRSDFLRLLEQHGVMPGRSLRVKARDKVAETVALRSESGRGLTLGYQAASRLWVEPGEG